MGLVYHKCQGGKRESVKEDINLMIKAPVTFVLEVCTVGFILSTLLYYGGGMIWKMMGM